MKEFSPEQVAKMRPEARERYENRLKIVKRNRKILKISCIVLASVVVILTLSLTVFFNISSIEVSKTGSNYDANQIIMASGLNVGDNMVRTSFKKVEERIEKGLPYVYDAVIDKTITGKVTITITDAKPTTVIATNGGYVIADAYGKTLQTVRSVPENSKLILLKLKGGITAAPGEIFTFNNESEKTVYDSIVSSLKNTGLYSHITEIDLTQKASLTVIYENRLRLILGTSDSIDEKIKSGAEVIGRENESDPGLIGEINLTIPKKVFVNPLESLNPPKEEGEVPVLNPEEGITEDASESQESEDTDSENDESSTETDSSESSDETEEE